MRSRLLAVFLLLCSLLPALAQDGAAGPAAPDDPLQALNAIPDAALVSEIRDALGEVGAARRDAAEQITGLDKQQASLEKTLAAVKQDHDLYRAAYDDTDGQGAPADDDVRAALQALRQALESSRSDAVVDRANGQQTRLHAALSAVRTWQKALDGRYRDWAARAREATPEADRDEVAGVLRGVRELHEAALVDLSDQLALARTTLSTCQSLRAQIIDRREDTVGLLRRENLTLRGHTDITVDALATGIRDLVELPSWAASTVRDGVAAVRSGAYSRQLGSWAGASLLVMALLALVRRRVRRLRLRPAEELDTDVERSKDLLWRLVAALLWAALLATPFLFAASLIESLPPGWGRLFRVIGYAVGCFWIGRALARRLLPGTDAWSPIELDARSAMLVRTGLVVLLWLTVILVPIAVALLELGYANAGARQAVWTLYKLLAVVVLLIFVLRHGVLQSFLPPENKAIGRVLRGVLAVAHPVLVLVGPALLALDFLQYDVLAEFLARLVGGVVVAGVAGFFAYGAIWKGLSAWIGSVVIEPPDVTPETSRVGAALDISRYVLRLLVLVGAFFLILMVKGGDVSAVEDVLGGELPFQGQVEGRHITWFNVIAGVALLTLFLTAVPKVKLALERFALPRTSLDSGLRYTISTLVGYVFAALGIYVALIQIFDLGALGYVFAALSVGIGFGLQEIVSNFVSGLILLFERPIKVGDLITVGETEGWVSKINIRATTIQTRDNVTMLIPNKDFITQAVVNSVYGDTILRVRVNVGVAYGSDTALVEKLLLQAATEHPVVLANRRTEVNFRDFGASSLDFTLLCWIPEAAEHMRVASALRFRIDQLFRENGVEIPFSQHDLHLRSIDDEAATKLRGG